MLEIASLITSIRKSAVLPSKNVTKKKVGQNLRRGQGSPLPKASEKRSSALPQKK